MSSTDFPAKTTNLFILVYSQLVLKSTTHFDEVQLSHKAWTNFSLQDEPWAEFSTLEVAACVILSSYGPVLQNNLT